MEIHVLLAKVSCKRHQHFLKNNRTLNHGICSPDKNKLIRQRFRRENKAWTKEAQTEGHETPQRLEQQTRPESRVWGHGFKGESNTLTAAAFSPEDVSGEDGSAKGKHSLRHASSREQSLNDTPIMRERREFTTNSFCNHRICGFRLLAENAPVSQAIAHVLSSRCGKIWRTAGRCAGRITKAQGYAGNRDVL